MQVRSLMTSPVHCLHLIDTYAHARGEMVGRSIHQLPVVDEKGRFQGILSMDASAARAPAPDTPVSRLVERGVPTVKPDTDSFACLRLLRDAKAHAAAVLDNGGALVGIVTLDDLRKDLGGDVDRVLHGSPPLREGY